MTIFLMTLVTLFLLAMVGWVLVAGIKKAIRKAPVGKTEALLERSKMTY